MTDFIKAMTCSWKLSINLLLQAITIKPCLQMKFFLSDAIRIPRSKWRKCVVFFKLNSGYSSDKIEKFFGLPGTGVDVFLLHSTLKSLHNKTLLFYLEYWRLNGLFWLCGMYYALVSDVFVCYCCSLP